MQRRVKKTLELPSWIFDVDDEDDIRLDTSLMEELDMDFVPIGKAIFYTIFSPWIYLLGKYSEYLFPRIQMMSIPLTFPMLGPSIIVGFYGLLLWIFHVNDVLWVAVIWFITSIFQHLIARVFIKESKLVMHFYILGYSVLPIAIMSLLIFIIHPPVWLVIIMHWLAVVWSTCSAYITYHDLCTYFIENDEMEIRRSLFIPPIILMELYLTALLPVKL
mmetsp:Transcript_35168/g.35811  ORF Transcript_35168/g.35811 Transcript_35168/m.35811 type:complete len:218 (-) Transcript_35168:122-775(-)